MNGECHITAESISFTYDRGWTWMERVFGKPSWRRSAVIAFVIGVPSTCLGLVSIALGFWHLAIYPLFIGIVAISAPFLALFADQYSYPENICRSDIRFVISNRPTTLKQGSFVITFLSEGALCKTGFCLPCSNYNERLQAFQAVTRAFVQNGLMSDTALHPNA